MGRPTDYTPELAERICEELMLSRSLKRICAEEDWCPSERTVMRWLAKDEDGFVSKYMRAREIQAIGGADEIRDIADTQEPGEVETDKWVDGQTFTEVKRADMLEHRKLRISVRQWNAEKLLPKVYGQKQTIEHAGAIGVNLAGKSDEDLVLEMLELLATGRLKLPNGIELAEVEDMGDEDDFSDIC